MNKEIKQKWLAALRSGEYKQGLRQLRIKKLNETYHCCLGVLCDLHAKETNTGWSEGDKYLGHSGLLPEEVQRWSGILTSDGMLKQGSLAIRNDSFLFSFDKIADIIEAQL